MGASILCSSDSDVRSGGATPTARCRGDLRRITPHPAILYGSHLCIGLVKYVCPPEPHSAHYTTYCSRLSTALEWQCVVELDIARLLPLHAHAVWTHTCP